MKKYAREEAWSDRERVHWPSDAAYLKCLQERASAVIERHLGLPGLTVTFSEYEDNGTRYIRATTFVPDEFKRGGVEETA